MLIGTEVVVILRIDGYVFEEDGVEEFLEIVGGMGVEAVAVFE